MPSKIKPSEVAQLTKKHEIPEIKAKYSDIWPCHSRLYAQPDLEIPLARPPNQTLPPPCFCESS